MKPIVFLTLVVGAFMISCVSRAADPAKDDDAYRPHTPTLIFHLTHADGAADADAIRASVQKLASVSRIVFADGAVRVRFDSHVVSYHQIAQAIADAGSARGKTFDPGLKMTIPEYAQNDNAAKVDAVLAGKRLNQRVRIAPLDKTRGEFLIHFLPLVIDPADSSPQGFNGGHLHHPIHDAPPRGLGLNCDYEASDSREKPAPAPAGFLPLFDGESLKGWHTAPRLGVPPTPAEAAKAKAPGPTSKLQQEARGRWEVRDGAILGGQDELRAKKPTGEDWGLGSWLMTDEKFGDFELLVDARPDWPCDTGIYVRSTGLGQGFQILLDHRGDDTDGIGGSVGFLYLRGIGGLRVNPHNFRWTVGADGLPKDVSFTPGTDGVTKMEFAASAEDFRKAWRMNDWNRFRIRVVGALPRITVWINDVKICECDTAAIRHPNYDPAAVKQLLGERGHLAFEVHDGPAWRWGIGKVSRWRNVHIRKL